MNIATLTAAQLLIRAELPIANGGPDGFMTFLQHAATLTDNPALSLLFSVLSEEPPEVAAGWAPALEEMVSALDIDGTAFSDAPSDHSTTDPILARAVSKALAQWKED